MKQYLLYKQVQERLNAHVKEFGEPFSFFEAVCELWRERAYFEADELPSASFEQWDISRIEGFQDCIGLAPVDLNIFQKGILEESTPIHDSKRIPYLDTVPMRIAENQAMGLHLHDSFELQYVMKGQARLYLEHTKREVRAGELCLIAPNFLHDIVLEGEGEIASISFAEYTIEQTLNKLLKDQNIVADFFHACLSDGKRGYMTFRIPPEERILSIIRSIFHEGYSKEEYAHEICVSYIEILFSYILRYYASEYERYSEEQSGNDHSPLLAILKYIQTNYKTTSLNEIAARFHYEPNYLGRLIKTQLGKNYVDIILDLKMSDAKQLLRTSSYSIEKVAECSGFQSLPYFSRRFKQATGITPHQYRLLHTTPKD